MLTRWGERFSSVHHARIRVSASCYSPAAYQFDLIDIDGPRHGQRLADFDVPADRTLQDQPAAPDPVHAARVRHQLREYARRNDYVVIEDTEAPAKSPETRS